jgi:hypothetical protein
LFIAGFRLLWTCRKYFNECYLKKVTAMNYSNARALNGNFGAIMKTKTEAERKRFVAEALARQNLQPIVPPEGLTPREQALYTAAHNLYRHPPQSTEAAETTGNDGRKRPSVRGVITSLIGLIL